MIEIIPNWHPILVHFSVALLITAALCHLAVALISNDSLKQSLTQVANWNLWIGTAITAFTVAAGWFAYNTVNHDTPSHLAMLEHRNWAIPTFLVYVVMAVWSFLRSRKNLAIHWPLTAAVLVAAVLLVSTAWHGGELVYRYGLGVMSLPKSDEHSHAAGDSHNHSHEHDHGDTVQPETAHSHDDNHEHEEDHDHGDASANVVNVEEHSHEEHHSAQEADTQETGQETSVSHSSDEHSHDHHDHSH